MSSGDNKKEELINDIELEMKSNNNTNSDILSIDDMPKKEIINNDDKSDPYTEIKLIKKEEENNIIDNNKENKDKDIDKLEENKSEKPSVPPSEQSRNIFGDLTSIIKDKIKTRNMKENNKNKKIRQLSAPAISTEEKNKKININMPTPSTTKGSKTDVIHYSKNNKTKASASLQKKDNNNNNKSEKTKKNKKNPELFINKRNNNNKNDDNNQNNGILTTRKNNEKKINFNDVLKRFDEEKQLAKKKFDNKKKELKDKESLIYTGKPKIKKVGNKYKKFSKDFLVRQKELNDNLNLKRKKLIEEDNKKKEKEYQKIISDSLLYKRMKKYKKHKSDDQWVERLYKEDTKKRKMEKEYMEKAYLPTFQPNLPKKRFNRSVDKINQIGDVLEEYNEKQNPQLLIDYFSKNKKFEDSDNLFRQKILGKFSNKNKKRSNSMDIDISEKGSEENSNDNQNNEDEENDE